MNTQSQPTLEDGAVICPATGKPLMVAADLARWLGCSPATISALSRDGKISRRGPRFFEVEEAEKWNPGRNKRGRKLGIRFSAEAGVAYTAMIGMVLTVAGATAFLPVLGGAATTMRGAVTWQDNTVKVAEELGLSCAKPARAEWDKNRAVAMARIEAAEAAGGGK